MAKNETRNKATHDAPAQEAAASIMGAMMQWQTAGLGPLRWLGTAWLEGMGDFGQEVAQFVAERIKEDVRTQHAILHCKDPAELQHIQAQFIQKAIDQYTDETGRLVELSQEFYERLAAAKED